MSVARACELLGLSRATYYRITQGYNHYQPVTSPAPQKDRRYATALSAAERATVVDILGDEQFESLSVCQTYWHAFDLGLVPCSQRTFYRIAKAERLVGDRRPGKHGGTPGRRTPKVTATAPGQLWSWDVTELKGVGRQRFKLYLVIDVFSRFPVAWRIEYVEDKQLAVDMFTEAFARHGAPQVLHADNGAIMRSADLLDLIEEAGTTASYSRPRVSDDNPFSESLFKTVKYDPACPERFDGITHAREWTAQFLEHYACERRHSGLGWHTPVTVFNGTATKQRARRQAMLDARYQANPQRFRRPPQAPQIPTLVGINHKPKKKKDLSQTG